MRAARLPAWSSPNFFITANGNAAHARRCCSRSSRSRKPFTRTWLPTRRGRSPSRLAAHTLRGRLLRAGEAATAEDEIALRAPRAVLVLLEEAEPVHPEFSFVARQCLKSAVERTARKVVRDGHVRVVREVDLAVERAAAPLVLEALALADALHERHEHDRRHRPERRRAAQPEVELLLVLRNVQQVQLDRGQRVRWHVGRWQQGHVRRDPGRVGVAEALPPALQLTVERLRQSDGDADGAARAIPVLPVLPLNGHPRAGRKPTASEAWGRSSPATLRAPAAAAAR